MKNSDSFERVTVEDCEFFMRRADNPSDIWSDVRVEVEELFLTFGLREGALWVADTFHPHAEDWYYAVDVDYGPRHPLKRKNAGGNTAQILDQEYGDELIEAVLKFIDSSTAKAMKR